MKVYSELCCATVPELRRLNRLNLKPRFRSQEAKKTMTAKSLCGIFVVCLLANLCSVIVGHRSRFNVPASRKKCPHLWTEYEDNCYMMYAVPATRDEAKTECKERQDATLVNVLTSREREFLVDYWNRISPLTDVIWLGLKRDSENTDDSSWDYQGVATPWDYGVEIDDFTDWVNDKPNDVEGEDCVVFIKGLGWKEHDCHNKKYPFVCMKSRV